MEAAATGGTVAWSAVFDTPVSALPPAKVSLDVGSSGASTVAVVTRLTDRTFRVAATGITGAGTLSCSLPQGAAQDNAGNPRYCVA
jgi:hypothetical protein